MILAGDVGGTKTLLGLFEPGDRRPQAIAVRSYPSGAYPSFTAILDAFAADLDRPLVVEAAAAGVAGPVVSGSARLTNVAWSVSDEEIGVRLGVRRVRLLNDLEALAISCATLEDTEVAVLQAGLERDDGHSAVIAAGTGLGQAFLHRVNGRLRPMPSEGGHADFAARSDREVALMQMLRAEYGRAEFEHVLSGPGLVNLHRFTHGKARCSAVAGLSPLDAPAAITQSALDANCAQCVEALDIFVRVYGAEAGNLALRAVATSGLFVGGGIAPKILPALQDGRFMEAFLDKGVMRPLVQRIPVRVILNEDAGLIGAAIAAQELLG